MFVLCFILAQIDDIVSVVLHVELALLIQNIGLLKQDIDVSNPFHQADDIQFLLDAIIGLIIQNVKLFLLRPAAIAETRPKNIG